MTAITRCPQCGTRFRVSREQLDACQGTVRCGCCRTVFNAIQTKQGEQQGEQQPVPVQHETAVPFHANSRAPGNEAVAAGRAQDRRIRLLPAKPEFVAAGSAQGRYAGFRPRWGGAALIMALLVAAQALYLFRTGLAAHLPAARPALAGYCRLLGCTLPLPQDLGQLRIVSSAMETAPKQPAIITLYAILQNRAPHVQSYPDLELTLTGTSDEALARRTFIPAEYLRPEQDAKKGIPVSEEIAIELYLDTEDLKPAGYRLLLSYS